MKDQKFAILGCGKIGTRHAAKLKIVRGAKLVAVCDVVAERADTLARAYQCRSYHSFEDLLCDTEVNFVNICTPSGFHPEHSIKALNAGKNVICEKPMAFREVDAFAMIQAARKAGKLLFVVKQNRFNPPVQLVSRLIQEGKIGDPIECVVNVFWNRNVDYYRNDVWRGTLELDGGTLYTQASHFVDLMLFFMGLPKSLSAFMTRNKRDIEIEDTGIVAIEFANGSLGTLNYTTCATNKNAEGSIMLIGKRGTIKIGGEYLNTIDYFEVGGVDSYELEQSDAGANDYGTYKGSMSNHDKVFAAIVAYMNGEKTDARLVSGDEAMSAVRFMEKAFESARKGGERISFS